MKKCIYDVLLRLLARGVGHSSARKEMTFAAEVGDRRRIVNLPSPIEWVAFWKSQNPVSSCDSSWRDSSIVTPAKSTLIVLRSTKQSTHGLTLHQFAGLVQMVVDDRVGRNAKGVID